MSKLAVFRRQASPGDTVTLRLTRGEDVTGRIAELDDHHVCLDLGQRVVTIFEDILAGWEVHHPPHPPHATGENPTGQGTLAGLPPAHHEQSEMAAEPSSQPVAPTRPRDPAGLIRLAQIEVKYREGAKHIQLQPPRLDFTFPDGEFSSSIARDVRRELDRAKSQYEYALKVREESRLVGIVGQVLRPLAERYQQSPAVHAVLGGLLLKLGSRPDAIDHFRTAAFASRRPDHWYALAYAATDSALECYALRNYLLMAEAADSWEAWLRYFSLAVTYSDASGIIEILDKCFSEEVVGSVREMAAETLVYICGRIEAIEVAQSTVAAIVSGEMCPPESWREAIRGRLTAPSDELAREEVRFGAISSRPPRAPSVPNIPSGRIASFGNGRFGFIEGEDGDTYFFRIDDVVDEGLKEELLDGAWRKGSRVEFSVVPSPGHRYHSATQVLRFQDIDALLQRAQQLARSSQYPQAMSLVRRAISSSPENASALRIQTELRDQMKRALSRGIGLPVGNGPFARAKRAQLVDQDLAMAERLLMQAIQSGDSTESAVKDLASLLQQMGRDAEAVSLIETMRKPYSGTSPYDSHLVTLLQHTGQHDEAIRILERLVRRATGKARSDLLRRIAFSHFKAGNYDHAERVLRDLLKAVPGDRTAERWLMGLEEARRSGSYDEAAQIFGGFGGLAEEGLELSPLARDAIAACPFEGVDPARLQSGAVTAKDVDRLEQLAKELGTRRPRDRAAYYLSAAAILKRQNPDEETTRIYDYLRRYFASMGDAAWIAKLPADTVRAYYTESLALVSEPFHEAWRTLVRYLATFSPNRLEEFEAALLPGPKRRYLASLCTVIKCLLRDESNLCLQGLLDAGAQSRFVYQGVIDAVATDVELRTLMAQWMDTGSGEGPVITESWNTQCRYRAAVSQEALAVCRTLTRHQLTVASIEDLSTQLRELLKKPHSDLDQRRAADLLSIVNSTMQFCRVSDFEDKEQHFWLVTTRAKTFKEQVQGAPTQFAHAGLLPIAEHLASLTEEQYAQTARTSAARLTMRLLVDHYVPSKDSEVKLQIETRNQPGCSPASNVCVLLGPPDSPYFETPEVNKEITPTLRGGSGVVAHAIIKLCKEGLGKPAFPIKAQARYKNRTGEECRTEEMEWTVRLYGEQEFQPLENRYAPWAEGGPVEDPQMFVGRAQLLDRLENSLLSGSGSKCIVMFGQKRSGKSSLLEHLRRRLVGRGGCLPVQFSLYDMGPALNEAAFFHEVLRSIAGALADLREQGKTSLDLVCPSLESFDQHPVPRFHEAMSELSRNMRTTPQDQRLTLVLLIDEFTEAFKQIRKGLIAEGFMKAWKAAVEKRYFASVLVGQDIMPAFKTAFPNEFGVTEDVRVTYLSESEARRLIEGPIGQERFAGNAVSRMLGLTAGSPFYTMMLCSRLVDYMNKTRAAVVTEADIAAVEQEMIGGDRRLTRDKFDNLVCAGDGIEDSGIDPDETLRLCAEIARHADRGWCSHDALRNSFERERLGVLLTDLERRDVVERKGDAHRVRVGLFHDWLLAQG